MIVDLILRLVQDVFGKQIAIGVQTKVIFLFYFPNVFAVM